MLNIVPMMGSNEIEFITSKLKPTHKMLEYGSGGSTLEFAKYVSEYYSIEHNRTWAIEVQQRLLDNTIYNVVPPKSGHVRDIFAGPPTYIHYENDIKVYYNNIPSEWNVLTNSDYYNELQDYIEFPKTLKQIFDVVLIDGRARPECAKFILDYIHEDTIVFIHDFYPRSRYYCVRDGYNEINGIKTGQSIIELRKK